jgi:2-polyprenyl-6-methoxyphenol hydroxylase-like FAD-dependent oxidoreductase
VHGLKAAADVALTDGTQLTADLLVGADGIHSHVRGLVFGPEARFLRYLGYQTAAYLVEDAALAQASQGCFRTLSVPQRQVAYYPLGHRLVATLFTHRAPTPARPPDPAAEQRRVYGDLGWRVPALLAAADRTPDLYYDVVAQVELPRWSMGHAVLVGDAGYAVSLLAGQGASLAIGGAYLLAEALATGGDIATGLAQFEAALAPEVRRQQAAGRRMADWFVPPTALHNWARDAFLNLVRVPALAGLLGWFFAPSLKSVLRRI